MYNSMCRTTKNRLISYVKTAKNPIPDTKNPQTKQFHKCKLRSGTTYERRVHTGHHCTRRSQPDKARLPGFARSCSAARCALSKPGALRGAGVQRQSCSSLQGPTPRGHRPGCSDWGASARSVRDRHHKSPRLPPSSPEIPLSRCVP